MAWKIEYDPRVERDLRDLDKRIQKEILDYMDTRIAPSDNPKSFGKPLRYSRKGLWRYRVQDYRISCQIQPERIVVLVVAVGHRSKVSRYIDSCKGRWPASGRRPVVAGATTIRHV